jgi:3'-phosphoadenosine 5'-phosphosulfate sulfotransferase (PAPS reductase)/FAD synthetase
MRIGNPGSKRTLFGWNSWSFDEETIQIRAASYSDLDLLYLAASAGRAQIPVIFTDSRHLPLTVRKTISAFATVNDRYCFVEFKD